MSTFTIASFSNWVLELSNMYLQFALIFSVVGVTWAACPSVEDAAPCTCDEVYLRYYCGSATNPDWDIKAYFDRIATLVPADVLFSELVITETNLTKLPSGSVQALKFNRITITWNSFLEYIHPNAFGETTSVTTVLWIRSNPSLANAGQGQNERELFDVVSKFKAVTTVVINHNGIRSIPDEGFGPLKNLRTFALDYDDLKHIGSRAFSQMPKLELAELSNCHLSIDEIAADAFEGVGPNAEIRMEFNSEISRLPEVPFRQLLDNAKLVAIGGQYCLGVWCLDIELDCDEQSAWMCYDVEKYRPKVKAFACKRQTGYKDIWEYCDGEVNNKN